jgi:7-cyano-7-deazaguanine synthase
MQALWPAAPAVAVCRDAARDLAQYLGAIVHTSVPLGLRAIGGSALADTAIAIAIAIAVPKEPSDAMPVTYMPARNALLLALALAAAEIAAARDIFIDVNALDYSGAL